VCDRNLTWVTLDSYASTLTVSKLALISGAIGVRHSNTIGGSGAAGDGIIATDLEIDHAYDFGIFLEEGYDAQFHGGTVTSCQFDAGVRIGAGYGVDWTIEGMRIFGNAKAGISVAHGSGKIQNNRIGHNGTLTANTYDGISVDDGVTRFVITGNFVGELGYTGNAQRTGIQLNGTLSDDYCVTGNDCSGNLTAAIFNGAGVATTRVVRNNVPDTTTGIIPDADYGDITVTISGTTWTIDNGVVTNAKLTNMAGARVKGRTLNAGTGAPTDMTGAEVGQIVRYGTDVEDTSTGTVASFLIANTTTSVRCTPATALTIQGIAYTGPADPEAGKEVLLYNSRTSAQNITLAHNSGSAGAAQYRLFLPGNVDMVIRPGDGVRLRYAFSRWIGGSPASVSDADYGDIIVTAGGGTWTIDTGVVTLAKQANLAQSTIQGRAEGAGTGVPQALTPTQVVAIIDGESPTWSASHRFDSFIQFGTSTALPELGRHPQGGDAPHQHRGRSEPHRARQQHHHHQQHPRAERRRRRHHHEQQHDGAHRHDHAHAHRGDIRVRAELSGRLRRGGILRLAHGTGQRALEHGSHGYPRRPARQLQRGRERRLEIHPHGQPDADRHRPQFHGGGVPDARGQRGHGGQPHPRARPDEHRRQPVSPPREH
jgi:hypothetical protein